MCRTLCHVTEKNTWQVIASFSNNQEHHWCVTRFEALFVARMLLQSLTVSPERIEIVSPNGNIEVYMLANLNP
jgi:hypothetical protein